MWKEYKYWIFFTFLLIFIWLFFNFFLAFKTIKVINHYENIKNTNVNFTKLYTWYNLWDIIVDNCDKDVYVLNNTWLNFYYGQYIWNVWSWLVWKKINQHCLYISNINLTWDDLINFCEKENILIPECDRFKTVFDYNIK